MSNDRPVRPQIGRDRRSSTAVDRSVSRADRAIRVSTAVAVIAVAGIAAYVSYWHAYEVVRAHGEVGVTARLEPATIDGLVYSSSMVVLYAARHQLPVPRLARWLLALGIIATLAANIAHGLSHGPVGAAVAAWPAASLVGSYELLLWLIRTAGGAERGRTAYRIDELTQRGSDLLTGDAVHYNNDREELIDGHLADDKLVAAWPMQPAENGRLESPNEMSVEKAAAAAYRVSVDQGEPLSERRLAAMFGRTSRRWARHRMAESQSLDPEYVLADKPLAGTRHMCSTFNSEAGSPRIGRSPVRW